LIRGTKTSQPCHGAAVQLKIISRGPGGWVGKNSMELIVGLFWSYEEDGRMKVRFHLESVTLVDGLIGLEGLVMIF
jgi:hypothetical protein